MNRAIQIWRLLNLPCDQMTRLASESLDRELSVAERCALRSHVLYCTACRRFMRQIMFLGQTLRRLATRLETDDLLPGSELPADVRERIKRALREG
jgi:predicted anti-sigma-YlaC factor YlaD